MTIDQISLWVDSHNLLVISILIPLVSAVSAFLASWYSTRRALKTERVKLNFEATLKIAEYRQSWIDTLRNELSEFQSYGVLPQSDPRKEREFYKLGTKIELLMNSDDPDYQVLKSKMYSFLEVADGAETDKYAQNYEFIEVSQKILKREWERLKTDIKNNGNRL